MFSQDWREERQRWVLWASGRSGVPIGGAMMLELKTAFGEVGPRFAWDERLLSLRQGGRPFSDHVGEFRTMAHMLTTIDSRYMMYTRKANTVSPGCLPKQCWQRICGGGTRPHTHPSQLLCAHTLALTPFVELCTRQTPAPAPAAKSAKGPDVPTFTAEGSRVAEDLERVETGLSLKFEAESDRYTDENGKIGDVFSRLEGRANALCVVGVQEERYAGWGDIIGELEHAFGDSDPEYTCDERLLNMRRGGRPFSDHISEFRTVAQRAASRRLSGSARHDGL